MILLDVEGMKSQKRESIVEKPVEMGKGGTSEVDHAEEHQPRKVIADGLLEYHKIDASSQQVDWQVSGPLNSGSNFLM